MTSHPRRWPLAALACVAAVSASAAMAAAPQPPKSDPEALHVLGDVARAYQALPAYSDRGEFVQAIKVNGKAQAQTVPIRLSLVRPNKLDVDAGEVRVVSDGKTLTTVVGPFKKFTEGPAPKTITFETFRDGPLGSLLFGGPSAPTSALVVTLLTDPDAAKSIAEGGGTITLEADRKVAGEATRSLLIDLPDGADFRLLIDPATKLLKSIDWVLDPKAVAAEAPPGQTIAIDRIGWTAGAVSTQAPKPDAFAYHAPAGFTKVEAFERPGGDEAKAPILELVGKPAPDFTMTLLEAGGKTRTITKADLAGKVVLIDFWATWCPPCREELPEIQKLIESYAKAGKEKELAVIVQSVDQKPRDPGELRTLIEKTFGEEKVTLGGTPVGLVAIDPSGTLGDSFAIQAIPALVILDGKGVVQAAYVGKQSRETLTKDLDQLLAGKSLLAPKPKGAAAADR